MSSEKTKSDKGKEKVVESDDASVDSTEKKDSLAEKESKKNHKEPKKKEKKKKSKTRPDGRDYEDRVEKEGQKDKKILDMILFPDDDLEVTTIKRDFRTKECSVTKEFLAAENQKHVQDSFDIFMQDWTLINHLYAKYDGKVPLSQFGGEYMSSSPKETPRVRKGQDSELAMHLLQQPKTGDRRNEIMKNLRQDLFRHYVVKRLDKNTATDTRERSEPFTHEKPIEICIDCVALTFELGEIEPFFCSLALFDIEKKKKISETFHFDKNSKRLMQLLGPSRRVEPDEEIDPETCGSMCIFRTYYKSPSIYLVIRLEKVMTNDNEGAVEPYFKHQSMKEKERNRLVHEIEALCKRIGKINQTFAWSACPVFGKDGKLLLKGDVKINDLVRSRSDHDDTKLFDLIRKKNENKLSKVIPAVLHLKVKRLGKKDNLPGRFDCSLRPVLPTSTDQVIREMEVTTTEGLGVQPALEYVNHLYVYVEHVNLNKNKAKGRSRNIAVRVSLKDNHNNVHDLGLQVIYAPSKHSKLVKYRDTPASYHNRRPVYYREVKIELPCNITKAHHLFFTFFHIPVKGKGKGNVENLCGYSFLPLLEENTFIEDGKKKLPVAYVMPPNYRDPANEESIQWLEHQKLLFVCTTKLISTVHTQDRHIQHFFDCYASGKDDASLAKAIQGIKESTDEARVKLFPLLCQQLLFVLCNFPNAATAAFRILPNILHSVEILTLVSGKRTRNTHLLSYVDALFKGFGETDKPLHEQLVKEYIGVLELDDMELHAEVGRFSWFIFELVMKSMTLDLDHRGGLNNNSNRKSRFSKHFMKSLYKMVDLLIGDVQDIDGPTAIVSSEINQNLALFFKDLLSIADRGYVFSMIDNYVGQLCPSNAPSEAVLVKFKFAMLQVIVDHEHYIPLNLPIELPIISVPAIAIQFWKTHFLAGLLVHEVCHCLLTESRLRFEAIRALRHILWKHDIDNRYAEKHRKQRVAAIYFPYIIMVLERVNVIKSMVDDEKREWLICFLWIVKNCNHEQLLRQWWKKDTLKSLKAFFDILCCCLETFKDEGELRREMCFTILLIVEAFMEDFQEELDDESTSHMQNMWSVVALLLQMDNSVTFMEHLFKTLQYYIYTYRRTLFRWRNTSYCGDLCFEILRHCNFSDSVVSTQAASLFYVLIKSNYTETKTFSRIKLQSTIAVSKLTGIVKEYDSLQKSLNLVAKYEERGAPKILTENVIALCERLQGVIRDSIKMKEYEWDPEMTADLYYQMSLGYTDSPDLRVTWLDNLCNFHNEQGNYQEAVQCQIHIVALISEYLNTQNGEIEGIPINNQAYSPVSPNIATEAPLPDIPLHLSEEEGMYNPKTFSESGLKNTLLQAVEIGKTASLYELVIDIYKYLIAIHQKDRNYNNLGECFRDLKTVCEKLVAAEAEQSRSFGNAFYVQFFGEKWLEMHKKEYVYRSEMNLAEFTSSLKAQFAKKFGQKKVKVIAKDDNKSPTKGTFSFKVIPLTEFFDKSTAEEEERVSKWDHKFNIDEFIYESTFTKGEGGDLDDQFKQKILLTTEKALPFVKTRVLVTSKKEIVLTPIENAIEAITTQSEALTTGMTNKNASQLQKNLHTAISSTKRGPVSIAQAFLSDNAEDVDENHKERLKTVIGKFVGVCRFALVYNRSIATEEQAAFQAELEEGYAKMLKELSAFIPGIEFQSQSQQLDVLAKTTNLK